MPWDCDKQSIETRFRQKGLNVSMGSGYGVVLRTVSHRPDCLATPFSTNRPLTGLRRRAYILNVDLKRDQLETRVATLELMLVTERARPKPHEDKIAKLEQELKAATAALEKYNRECPR